MTKKAIRINNIEYNLEHLNSYIFTTSRKGIDNKPGWSIKIEVSFSWHCYTRSPKDNEKDAIYTKGRDKRCFCPIRYEYSKKLTEIIKTLDERKILQTGKGNFLTIEIINEKGEKREYEIYFTLANAGKKRPLKLFIESAYIRDDLHGSTQQKRKHQPIRFRVIVYNLKNNKHVRYYK